MVALHTPSHSCMTMNGPRYCGSATSLGLLTMGHGWMTSGEMPGKLASQFHAPEQRLRTPQRRSIRAAVAITFASRILVTAQFQIQGISPGRLCSHLNKKARACLSDFILQIAQPRCSRNKSSSVQNPQHTLQQFAPYRSVTTTFSSTFVSVSLLSVLFVLFSLCFSGKVILSESRLIRLPQTSLLLI